MLVDFEKYHGSGNDFILIDNRSGNFLISRHLISQLCHPHYGIGADGLMLIEEGKDCDFEMKYFNSDGRIGSMCGNGGRCAVKFAEKRAIVSRSERSIKFMAYDGMHEAIMIADNLIKISMLPVNSIEKKEGVYILNSGSPHYVKFVDDVALIDVVNEGRKIRNGESFQSAGINVNFVSVKNDAIYIRTYERGVEDETLSCGTGTVAAALAFGVRQNKMRLQQYEIHTPGGVLKVYFNRISEHSFDDVWLEGPVSFVFKGCIEI